MDCLNGKSTFLALKCNQVELDCYNREQAKSIPLKGTKKAPNSSSPKCLYLGSKRCGPNQTFLYLILDTVATFNEIWSFSLKVRPRTDLN